MVMALEDQGLSRPTIGGGGGASQPIQAGWSAPTASSTQVTTPSESPYVPRDIEAGASPTSWGDYYRNLIGQGGGSGGAGPAPEALTPQLVTPGTIAPTQIDWQWQSVPSSDQPDRTIVGPGGTPAGGGGGRGGGGWDVSQVNLGQYAMNPTDYQVGMMDPITAAQQSQQYQNFLTGMYGRMGDYMNQPTGYSPAELEMMQTRESDRIAREGALADQARRQQLNQMGLLGGGTEMGLSQQAQDTRGQQLAQMRTDLALQDMALRRQGAESAMQMGSQFAGQMGGIESQQQQMANQIAMNNQQIQKEISVGNVDRATEIARYNSQLQAQSDQLNQAASNEAMMLRNQLATQRGIAAMQVGAQRDIASQANALQRELSINEANLKVAMQNGDYAQAAMLQNNQNQLQADLANMSQDWTAQVYNADRMDAWNRANAAAGGAGRRWDQQMMLQGIGQDIAQQQYNDQLMLNLLGMNQNWQNQNLGYAGQYGQNVYESNPNAYVDPYANLGYGGGIYV